MRSYSVSFVAEVECMHDWSPKKLGPALGMRCIGLDIPVAKIAVDLGVSRYTVYRWFSGRGEISRHLVDKVKAYYDALPPPAATGS